MTTATTTMAPAMTISSQPTATTTNDTEKVLNDIEECWLLHDAQFADPDYLTPEMADHLARKDIVDFQIDENGADELNKSEVFHTPEPAPSRFADYVDKVSRTIRRARSRFVARTKGRASNAEKYAPPKTIELTAGIKRQIWETKELSCNIDWNRVKFDKPNFLEFNKLVAKMPTKRRRWFRQRFCFAGVVAT